MVQLRFVPRLFNQSFRSFSSAPAHRRFVLLGAPGVGKGTYAKFIRPAYHIPSISTGDLVRAEIKSGSALGEQIKAATNSGQLLDDSVILTLLNKRLADADCQAGYMLDGFPRRVTQAQAMEQISEIDLVINLELRNDILVHKLSARRVCNGCGANYNLADINEGEYVMPPLLPKKEGHCDKCAGTLVQRSDDTEAVVRDRLKIYQDETFPLVDYYTKKGKLMRFEVKKGVEDVPRLLSDIDAALNSQSTADVKKVQHV